MKKILSTVVVLAMAFGLTNCAKNISADQYAENEIGAVKQTYRGTILSVRLVKVQGGDSLQDNTLGLVGGGVGGGLLGSQLGKGRGQIVGGVLGAAAGALGGALLEKTLKEQDGIEYTIELTSGRVMTIVQALEPRLQPGQPVLVMVGNKGRSRVVADPSGGISYVQPRQAVIAPSAVEAPTTVTTVRRTVIVEQPASHFDDIDANHRDAYGRDVAERSPAPRMIVQ